MGFILFKIIHEIKLLFREVTFIKFGVWGLYICIKCWELLLLVIFIIINVHIVLDLVIVVYIIEKLTIKISSFIIAIQTLLPTVLSVYLNHLLIDRIGNVAYFCIKETIIKFIHQVIFKRFILALLKLKLLVFTLNTIVNT